MIDDVRRQSRRYTCDTEVGVVTISGKAYISGTLDISEEGVLLSMPVDCVAGLMQDGAEIIAGETLEILLPNHDHSKDFQVTCSIVHTKAVIDGSYIVGVKFLDQEAEVKEHIAGLKKDVK